MVEEHAKQLKPPWYDSLQPTSSFNTPPEAFPKLVAADETPTWKLLGFAWVRGVAPPIQCRGRVDAPTITESELI